MKGFNQSFQKKWMSYRTQEFMDFQCGSIITKQKAIQKKGELFGDKIICIEKGGVAHFRRDRAQKGRGLG